MSPNLSMEHYDAIRGTRSAYQKALTKILREAADDESPPEERLDAIRGIVAAVFDAVGYDPDRGYQPVRD